MSRSSAAGVLLTGLALAACGSSNGSGLTTASILDNTVAGTAAEVGKFRNDDPNARPVFVAWTAARAQRCGFYFDAAKLKTNYLAYEQTQGVSGPAVATIDKTYDTTQKSMATKIAEDQDYCQTRKAEVIKGDLNRLLGGDYRPNFPQPKAAPQTSFLDNFWSDGDGKKVEAAELFKKMDQDRVRGK